MSEKCLLLYELCLIPGSMYRLNKQVSECVYNHTERYLSKKRPSGVSKYLGVQNTYVNVYDGGLRGCNL